MSVMNFLYSWLQDLSILFIMISIIDLIMPKGSMKKYIDLIVGLMIIVVIITPFARLRKENFSLDIEVYKELNDSSFEYMEQLIDENNRQVKDIYIDKVKNVIEYILSEDIGYYIQDIHMDFEEKGGVYGDIRSIEIIIKHNGNRTKNVKGIDIGHIMLKEDEDIDDSVYLLEKIKEDLAYVFNLGKDSIEITIENKGRK